jgi:hypothetical protein
MPTKTIFVSELLLYWLNEILTIMVDPLVDTGDASAPEGDEGERQDHRRHHAATHSQKDWPPGVASCVMRTMLLGVSVIIDTQWLLAAYEVDPDGVAVNGASRAPSFQWNVLVKGIAGMCG